MEKLTQPLEGVQRKRLDEGNMHKNRFHVKVPSMSVVQKGIVQQSASGPVEPHVRWSPAIQAVQKDIYD